MERLLRRSFSANKFRGREAEEDAEAAAEPVDEGAAPEKSKQGEMNPEFVEKTVQSLFLVGLLAHALLVPFRSGGSRQLV